MPLRKQEKSSRSNPLYIPSQRKHKTFVYSFLLVLHKPKHENNSSYFRSLPEKRGSPPMDLLKKVSMKMPSFPILSWSVSSKSSRVTNSSSCKSKGDETWVDLCQTSSYSTTNSAWGSLRKGQQIADPSESRVQQRDPKCFIYI